MKSLEFILRDEDGLHLRPASDLAKRALRFDSRITLAMGDLTADGKSVLSMLMLELAPGNRLRLEVDGPDEEQAYRELSTLIVSGDGGAWEAVAA